MEVTEEFKTTIKALAAHNASKFGGKANPGSIIGQLIQNDPEIKKELKTLNPIIQGIIKEVNDMGVDAQVAFVEEHAPQLLEKKEREERDIYSSLRIEEGSKVVSAFPPEPSKYPHIGHAKSAMLNYGLAKRYDGEFKLRFDDTNPTLAKKEFYDIHMDNYKWLGIEWKEVYYASDYVEKFYELCEKLISEDKAYACTCDGETIKDNRWNGNACACRDRSVEENNTMWQSMLKDAEAGSMIIRLKIDAGHKNTTMRDPTIMRIIDEPHIRTGDKYRVWPNYDFETTIMDGIMGVTHRIRTKEFEMRKPLQHLIQEWCGFSETYYHDIARFNMTGVLSSGRVIREKVDSGELCGWDDPRLTTIVALRRRGFHPEAILNFVVSTGMTKNEATLTWDDLIVHNKKYLEENADRFFFVPNPQQFTVSDAPSLTPELSLHPEHRKGGRKFTTTTDFLIADNDVALLEEGKVHRLMDCVNFTKEGDGFKFHSQDFTEYKGKGGKIIHWLPQDESQQVNVHVRMNDGELIKGKAELGVESLDNGTLIQFERFGFCRKDRTEDGVHVFWFTH